MRKDRVPAVGATYHRKAIACGVALLATCSLGTAAPIDFSLKTNSLKATDTASDNTQLDSGLELALQSALVELAVDYKVQSRFEDSGDSVSDGTSQKVGAQLQSNLVDKLLGGKARVRTESVFTSGTEKYRHQLNPTYSRSLLDLATLDMGYKYGLERASAIAAADESSSYEFGLKGSLPWLPMEWSGGYSASSKLKGGNSQLINTESFRLQSNYNISSQMKVKLFSKLKEETKLAGESEHNSSEIHYGAGLSWQPSNEYVFDLAVNRQTISATGEESLLRSGAVSWYPNKGLELSLQYGDQLVEGARGLMFNTEFDLDRLWN